MTDQDDQDNPFSAFADSAAIMAFVHASCGEAALKELLVALNADRETLTGHAEILAEMGLQQITDIVLEHAADVPASANICPLDETTDPANHWDWHARQYRKAKRATWGLLPDHLYGCCNGLLPDERPLNWDSNRKKVLSSGN
jgi:hypothetical protein